MGALKSFVFTVIFVSLVAGTPSSDENLAEEEDEYSADYADDLVEANFVERIKGENAFVVFYDST